MPENLQIDPEREVRFAVVMYGGVSLAIYINGVTQELLNMVRATAPKEPGSTEPLLTPDTITGSEAVYRKLAQYLDQRRGETDSNTIRTRFIVDVISGTSAGGINGVFLAKALARNQKMDGLKTLWLQEGDLSKLLNDSESVSDLSDSGFKVRRPEQSLLNSQRMYRKLLEALDQMSAKKPDSTGDSPLVGELDLFITTTDIEGIPLPIRLADEVIYERRYKNVFHFRYVPQQLHPDTDQGRDDFKKENDPFLAFAARCTSSFPFAFEPMCWADIEEVINSYPRYADTDVDSEEWDRFFSEYLRHSFYDIDKDARGEPMDGLSEAELKTATERLRKAFRTRAFGDGGYLDNKPFSHATAMLMRRHSDCVVDRKLVYVEPSPEHPELMPHQPARPDFAENVQAAVLDLPRQETIREDLDRLYERNEMLERVANFAKNVDQDLECLGKAEQKHARTRGQFIDADLCEMIRLYGVSYGAYHRLRVDETTRMIADLLARAAGHDPSSDAVVAIRELVAAWRSAHYVAIKKADGEPTENLFLSDFDFPYRLRRLFFLERQISALWHLGESGGEGDRARDLFDAGMADSESKIELTSDEQLDEFRDGLAAVKKQVGERLKVARFAQENLLKRDPSLALFVNAQRADTSDPKLTLSALISELQLSWTEMKQILAADADARPAVARAILDRESPPPGRSRSVILRNLADVISAALIENLSGSPIVYQGTGGGVMKPGDAARACLEYSYRSFAHYDLVTYPVQYGTGATESNIIDVFRISPEDAKSLIDERAPGNKRQKLAGRTLMSFGAFLDERWRKNDMLWGRLDGAERLITALLPAPGSAADLKVRDDLIKEAHKAILTEVVQKEDVQTASRLLSNVLASYPPGSEQLRNLRNMVKSLKKVDLSETMQSALQKCLEDPEELYQYYKNDFEVNREMDAEHALRLISRATTITGNMLEGLADKYRFAPGKRVAIWIARLGSWFWSLVTVAVPRSLPNLFFRHWLGILYVFDILLIVGGTFLDDRVKLFGWQALGITVALNIAVSGLGHYITSRMGWMRLFRILLGVLLIGLIVCGALYLNKKVLHLPDAGQKILVGVIGGSIALVVAYVEWWRWVKSFLAIPNPRINYRALALWTGATLFGAGVLAFLGPERMAGFEFAGSTDCANAFIAAVQTDDFHLRRQLVVDYLFIIAYAAMLASYCVAGAKLCWQGRVMLAQSLVSQTKVSTEDQEKARAKVSFWMRALYGLVVTGFALAGLQWIAALSDATENSALLWFLAHRDAESSLRISYWAATVKFSLAIAGALYSLIAFVFGIFWVLRPPPASAGTEDPERRKRRLARRWFLSTLAFVSLVLALACSRTLYRCATNPEQCFPTAAADVEEKHPSSVLAEK
jgi:patatin-related protein